jgi:hypothetical protein
MAMAVVVFLAGVSIASANVIREDIEFEGRPVVVLLPENYDNKGNDLIPLILHLHGAVPFPDIPDLELDNSGYRDLQASIGLWLLCRILPTSLLDTEDANWYTAGITREASTSVELEKHVCFFYPLPVL